MKYINLKKNFIRRQYKYMLTYLRSHGISFKRNIVRRSVFSIMKSINRYRRHLRSYEFNLLRRNIFRLIPMIASIVFFFLSVPAECCAGWIMGQ